ncbi:hypothetical protein GQ44DRAFT_770808 [Phaeosphaeriaceae sp. PMI808]|nr:hypothetical protein GQ44DRAFT_770808 [Phaeosphaeriaceae sp. PMI808]
MDAQKPNLLTTTTNTLITFFALYLTTLFSTDSWAAARNSPYRAPGASSFYRTASVVEPGSYQAGMHGRGNRGPGSGGNGGRGVGRVPQVRDSRAPIGMGATASCGACMT